MNAVMLAKIGDRSALAVVKHFRAARFTIPRDLGEDRLRETEVPMTTWEKS